MLHVTIAEMSTAGRPKPKNFPYNTLMGEGIGSYGMYRDIFAKTGKNEENIL